MHARRQSHVKRDLSIQKTSAKEAYLYTHLHTHTHTRTHKHRHMHTHTQTHKHAHAGDSVDKVMRESDV